LPGENASVAGGGDGTWPGFAAAGAAVPNVSAASTMLNERSFLKPTTSTYPTNVKRLSRGNRSVAQALAG
jgi:hypothetical protein